jgi:hypothetical protein
MGFAGIMLKFVIIKLLSHGFLSDVVLKVWYYDLTMFSAHCLLPGVQITQTAFRQ